VKSQNNEVDYEFILHSTDINDKKAVDEYTASSSNCNKIAFKYDDETKTNVSISSTSAGNASNLSEFFCI
jgi:hypothetical protein